MEINAEVLLKATKVDGIYDKDPKKFNDARRYETMTFIDALQAGAHVMDSTAFSLCLDNKLRIIVFDLTNRGQHPAGRVRRARRDDGREGQPQNRSSLS